MAENYQQEIDFAFFVVNFHYTKRDYEALTPKEKLFIYKAWETKTVSDTTYIANAVNNAIGNALRKKGKQAVPLWKKKPKQLNAEKARGNLELVRCIEESEGKAWVDLIYKRNGIKKQVG